MVDDEYRRQVILVGQGEDPRAAVKANVNQDQYRELEFFSQRSIPPINAADEDNWVPIHTYGVNARVRGVKHLLRAEDIAAYSDNFQLYNGFQGNPVFKPIEELISMIDLMAHQRRPPAKSVILGADVRWKPPTDLVIKVTIDQQRKAHVVYECPEKTLLKVECSEQAVSVLSDYIVFDATGKHISPSARALEGLVQNVRDLVCSGAVDGFNRRFSNGRDWGIGGARYRRALDAAKTLAKRMGTEVDVKEIEQLYRGAWNSKLEADMPEILAKMNHGLSLQLAGKTVSWQFADSPSKQIEVIIDLANQDLIDMSRDSYLALGRAVVLNQRCLVQTETNRLRDARKEARELGGEIARLSQKRDDLLSGMAPLRQEVRGLNENTVRERNTLLWRLNLPDENAFAARVEPDDVSEEIKEPERDQIPF